MNVLDWQFSWKTKGGFIYTNIEDMKTNHIFNIVRMLWNHTAPESKKLRPYIAYADIPNWDTAQTSRYIVTFVGELMKRGKKELLLHQANDLQKMIEYINSESGTNLKLEG